MNRAKKKKKEKRKDSHRGKKEKKGGFMLRIARALRSRGFTSRFSMIGGKKKKYKMIESEKIKEPKKIDRRATNDGKQSQKFETGGEEEERTPSVLSWEKK